MLKILGWKGLAIGIIILFISTSIIPLAGCSSIEKEQSIVSKSYFDGIYINGTMGENGWYRGPVTVTFANDNDTWVHLYVKIDDGAWFEYTEPFILTGDGVYTIWWYYVDQWGNQSPTYSIHILIDSTPPVIFLTKERIGLNRFLFTINASDATSGISRIEFYVDDQLLGNITTPPYEWAWSGSGRHTVKATAYDFAGNNASSSISTPYDQSQNNPSIQQHSQALRHIYQNRFYDLLRHLQMTVYLFQD